ncbi:phage minor head protein [Yersinia intermedia]|uniref:phage minor head protein n=1 Tax=Yersinia TaxID=629 RepID=UPI0022FE7F0B|nr:phage minor head protein [Yersinia intermedia]MDA5481845.1 phage minor head protein [Yersinia intermedia]
MINKRPGLPVIPRNKADPTQSSRQVNKMRNNIAQRYYDIKVALRQQFDIYLTGTIQTNNSQSSAIICNNEADELPSLYYVNAGEFIYDMDARRLAALLEIVQTILDDYLLEGNSQNIWAMSYVSSEFERGTLNAYTNLAAQSPVYAAQTTLSQLLFSAPYLNQIQMAYVPVYSDWKGLSDTTRADLANVLADAIGRGINPRETASIISKRLDVSMSKAEGIAQTEQVGALRQAQWAETEWAKERLGLNTMLLHLSALKPTTRMTHAYWHGRLRTVDDVREWYSIDGNKYWCYCSQIPAIVDDNGKLLNPNLIERLIVERKQWQETEGIST